MADRLPRIIDKYKICIICEGNEEYEYLMRSNALKVWSRQYDFSFVNACGNGNIPARYQDRYQNGSDDALFVFCDTEKKPHEQYEDIKHKINMFHGVDCAAKQVVIFGNPCTLQVIVKHWTAEDLKTSSKSRNAPLIEKYTGVMNDKGRADQLKEIMKHITADNYLVMRERVNHLDMDDSVNGSSNFGLFLKLFESDNCSWINDLNEKIM